MLLGMYAAAGTFSSTRLILRQSPLSSGYIVNPDFLSHRGGKGCISDAINQFLYQPHLDTLLWQNRNWRWTLTTTKELVYTVVFERDWQRETTIYCSYPHSSRSKGASSFFVLPPAFLRFGMDLLYTNKQPVIVHQRERREGWTTNCVHMPPKGLPQSVVVVRSLKTSTPLSLFTSISSSYLCSELPLLLLLTSFFW